MTDILVFYAANKSFQQKESGPDTINDNEALTMGETVELSNIFKSYLQEKMRIFATSNMNGNYYAWDNDKNGWLNRSSGHILYTFKAAETANLNKRVQELDDTVFDLLNPATQSLKKRQWLRFFLSPTKHAIQKSLKTIELPPPTVSAKIRRPSAPPGSSNIRRPSAPPVSSNIKRPSAPPVSKTPSAPPVSNLRWNSYFADRIKNSKTLLLKSGSVSFMKTLMSLATAWNPINSLFIRKVIIGFIILRVRTFMADLSSQDHMGLTTQQTVGALKAISFLHDLVVRA